MMAWPDSVMNKTSGLSLPDNTTITISVIAGPSYANEERIQAAELEHLSEFRLGSTWLVVTIVPRHFKDSTWF